MAHNKKSELHVDTPAHLTVIGTVGSGRVSAFAVSVLPNSRCTPHTPARLDAGRPAMTLYTSLPGPVKMS
jgi:hypothetical protein